MRLIDADALQKALAEKWYEASKRLSGIKVSMLIDEQPTIEPKTGRWIENEGENKHVEKIYYCSNCRDFEAWGEYEKSNYCPNCGAKMEK